MADELAQNYRVLALVQETELAAWEGVDAEVVVLEREIANATVAVDGRWVEEAARIERETGLTAYRAAQPYLLYRRFSLKYYGKYPSLYEREERILRDYVGSYFVLT